MVRRCVLFINLVNDEALAHWEGLLRQKKEKEKNQQNALLKFYLSFWSCDSCRRLPEPKHDSFLFSHFLN